MTRHTSNRVISFLYLRIALITLKVDKCNRRHMFQDVPTQLNSGKDMRVKTTHNTSLRIYATDSDLR